MKGLHPFGVNSEWSTLVARCKWLEKDSSLVLFTRAAQICRRALATKHRMLNPVGDIFNGNGKRGPPWISEMYGYVFGAAVAGEVLSHTQLYLSHSQQPLRLDQVNS